MSTMHRMSDTVVTNIQLASLFAGDHEAKRMEEVRTMITKVRQFWHDHEKFHDLKVWIWKYIQDKKLSPKVKLQITELFAGYSDWADMDFRRPSTNSEVKYPWHAIELYCSEEGYELFFKAINALFRDQNVEENAIIVAVALVEFVTIELYNLRLINIGDPQYENFQGIVYRGMGVSRSVAEEFAKAARHCDISRRNFAIPLGFMSSSTSKKKMEDFVARIIGGDLMYWTIHIHGLEPNLLRQYHARYPDSVVTSICAMPVARVAELAEKEILLRGPFFHIIQTKSEEIGGRMIHNLQVVMLNVNRDHGTEHSLNEGPKKEQREFFRNMVLASRYEICASLSREFSEVDAEGYNSLAKEALKRIQAAEDEQPTFTAALPETESCSTRTWYGDLTGNSLPQNYIALRKTFERAAIDQDWTAVLEIMEGEYDWQIADWFNLPTLGADSTRQTLLHELALHGRPVFSSKHVVAWKCLLALADKENVWRTLPTKSGDMAIEFAERNRDEELQEILQPRILHTLERELFVSLESQLHALIKQTLLDNNFNLEDFMMPPLSILTEMQHPRIWVPIPLAFIGFIIYLHGNTLKVQRLEIVKGKIEPQKIEYHFKLQPSDSPVIEPTTQQYVQN